MGNETLVTEVLDPDKIIIYTKQVILVGEIRILLLCFAPFPSHSAFRQHSSRPRLVQPLPDRSKCLIAQKLYSTLVCQPEPPDRGDVGYTADREPESH